MEIIEQNKEKIKFIAETNVSLANAIRRSVSEISTLAIKEVDFYKNDSALYDEIIAHRLGLIPLKNQKLKQGELIELKLKKKSKDDNTFVKAGELGEEVVYPEMPIVLLGKNQEIEFVAKAGIGTGLEHSKFIPGLLYYKHLPKIKINKEGESHIELANNYSDVFEFKDKLKVKDATKCEIDNDDLKDFPGVEVSLGKEIVFNIESWGQIDAKNIFNEACKVLKSNLLEVSRALK